jgi:hypothetical protein
MYQYFGVHEYACGANTLGLFDKIKFASTSLLVQVFYGPCNFPAKDPNETPISLGLLQKDSTGKLKVY